MKLSDVADRAGLTIQRDGEFRSVGLLSHETEQMLAQFYDAKFLKSVRGNGALSCIITTAELAPQVPEHLGVGIAAEPASAFYRLHAYLMRETSFYGPDFDSVIAPSARIHERAYVAPKNVRIGENTVIEPNVTIMEGSVIGADCVIRAGTVIGGEGFEPKWVDGKHVIWPHAGGVWIGDRVELQSLCHVARSVFGGYTRIGDDTKIDAMVHVAHNAVIGCGCEISAMSAIGGSVTIGNKVWVGTAKVSSGITVGDGAFITVGSVVIRNVPEGGHVTGNFAVDHAKYLSFFRRLNSGKL
ncbi:MAG: UDP-3-O-(3-hydroxymyristoyl)glucosamine N-acyltransferase [Methylotetracoccus sp.]